MAKQAKEPTIGRWIADDSRDAGEVFSIAGVPISGPMGSYAPPGRLGMIFGQDLMNIAGIARHLRSGLKHGLEMAKYQEARIRQYHNASIP